MRAYKILSFSVVLLLITVVFAGAVTVPAAAQNDTMQFRYNAQHTGDYSPVAGPVPSNGQLLWNYTITGYVGSSPAVVNGVVYVGSADNIVYALNATTGTKLWNYTTGGNVESSPAVANGVVYVGSDDNNVYALNATTGAKLWNYTTDSYVYSSPAVVNGVVYVGSVENNGIDNNVYALNATTGTKLWSYATRANVYSSPAVANGMLYIGSEDWNLYALNATTGAFVWSYAAGYPVFSSPAVVNGVVYVGCDNHNTYALNATTGAFVWSYTIGGQVLSSPAVANGVVYVGSFQDGTVYALNATSGAKLWNYTTGNEVFSSPAVANGVVYVGSLDNNTYALNATTGAKLWSFTTGGAVWSSPAVVNGVVYVGSADGNVYAIGNESVSQQTTLTVSAPSFAAINRPFTINGTLNTTGGTAISGATIQLQKNVSGTWANVTGKTNTTTSTGAYRISTSEPAVGTYQYRTIYAGNASVASATSPVVSVKVVSKASVLADLNALRLTVMGIPSSAFIPGTKIATLALISAAEINVRVGNPGAAATELKTALLPHISGCSATGKPDKNDWVRTCAAQGQLYPQVQNLIQELQALQGS
ncbi:MAG: PQQ-binding-like beta-propeller repeat protein [Halobacteriota archaeon]